MADEEFAYPGTELLALAGARNYYRWILSYFRPYLGNRMVEVGSGVGTFAQLLLDEGRPDALTLVEPAANLFPSLERRFALQPRVNLVHGHLDDVSLSIAADCFVLVNVLEHVENDGKFLDAIRMRLVAPGRLLLLVPAGPALFGTLDVSFGHYRRYTRTSLSRVLEQAGFRIASLRYFNLAGCLTWFIAGKVLKKTTLSAGDVQLYDRWVVPWVSAFERACVVPVGQSLLAVCEVEK